MTNRTCSTTCRSNPNCDRQTIFKLPDTPTNLRAKDHRTKTFVDLMRVLQLIYVAALVLRCAAVKTATKPHTTSTVKINSEADAVSRVLATQTTRSLRQFDQEKLAEDDDEDEERGFSISGPVETIVTKARTGLKSVLTKISIERVLLASQLSERYPYAQGLSLSTLKQLATIEKLRKIDIEKGIKGSKLTPGSMRRSMEKFSGMSTVPRQFLESHVGRKGQRFGRDGSRLLSAGVVTRVNEKGEHQMLLISSSNPKKSDFLPPKGGWDKGESIKKAACVKSSKKEGYVHFCQLRC